MGNPLQFAASLARLREHLEQDYYRARHDDFGWGYIDTTGVAIGASYYVLLDRLAEVEGEAVAPLTAAVAEALDVYHKVTARIAETEAARRDREKQRHAEAERRHALAVRVECPYCGAEPGQSCITRGPSGRGQAKGVQDHVDRYRAAENLLGRAEPGQ